MSIKLISIFKRADRKYYIAEYEINKQKHSVSLKTDNEKEAWQNWHKILKKYDEKFSYKIKEIKIEKAIDEFLVKRNKELQESSKLSDNYRIKIFKEFFSQKNTFEITDIEIDNFFKMLDNKNLGNKTINNYISLLNIFFKFCLEKKYILNIPFKSEKYWKKRIKEKKRIIDIKEARLLLEKIKEISDIKIKTFLLAPFFTGMRFSEIRGLNRKNIDFEKRIITICEKIAKGDKNPITLLKSKAAYRKVPLMKEFSKYLEEFLNINDENYPFLTITNDTMIWHIEKINKKNNINFNFHQGRHFFASLLIDNKFSMKEIQTILGHENISTTLDTYGHLIREWDIKKFDEIFF